MSIVILEFLVGRNFDSLIWYWSKQVFFELFSSKNFFCYYKLLL